MVRTSLTDLKHSFQLTTLVLISVFVTLFAHRRERHEKELTQLRSVAEAAQQVVLRPLPRRIGPLRIASVYLAAEAEAQIGGDLFAAARAGQGTRFIVGDVRGKGLGAIGDAALLLGAFRSAAHRQADLTASVLDIPDDAPVVHLINCGHPPPLLLHKGQVTSLEVSDPAPPLGLEEFAAAPSAAETFPFEPGDFLLLYTDGVIEARDGSGAFYPLAQRMGTVPEDDAQGFVRHLQEDLLAYTPGGHLGDDAAMVAIERGLTARTSAVSVAGDCWGPRPSGSTR
ncbi:PP2C family protein-serine/threonine phosphatase [Streptomyces sp. TRM72054]|uniref:PP2C family protein-serine/threonine phosphatase n=1 Tax=Streptomyces sp. TRM72054 TaxID=2870562 RepID=UPI0027DFC836|nr:PP2C family protein-serine/threonine phosphatase [Streptomyces sp. TRM72054]